MSSSEDLYLTNAYYKDYKDEGGYYVAEFSKYNKDDSSKAEERLIATKQELRSITDSRLLTQNAMILLANSSKSNISYLCGCEFENLCINVPIMIQRLEELKGKSQILEQEQKFLESDILGKPRHILKIKSNLRVTTWTERDRTAITLEQVQNGKYPLVELYQGKYNSSNCEKIQIYYGTTLSKFNSIMLTDKIL